MELTPHQLSAARACGCAFSPATEDQIRRLSAQRRVFRIDGAPFVAARGGFFETWATLAALIEDHRPAAAEQGAGAAAMAAPEHGVGSEAGPPPATAPLDAATAEASLRDTPVAPRRRRAPRAKPAPADTGAVPTVEAAVESSEAEEMLAGVAAAQVSAATARAVGRRRAGEPPTPRWMVAGKMRRGRLK